MQASLCPCVHLFMLSMNCSLGTRLSNMYNKILSKRGFMKLSVQLRHSNILIESDGHHDRQKMRNYRSYMGLLGLL